MLMRHLVCQAMLVVREHCRCYVQFVCILNAASLFHSPQCVQWYRCTSGAILTALEIKDKVGTALHVTLLSSPSMTTNHMEKWL